MVLLIPLRPIGSRSNLGDHRGVIGVYQGFPTRDIWVPGICRTGALHTPLKTIGSLVFPTLESWGCGGLNPGLQGGEA